jgi:aminoglycoside phosphotransferase (APT) family kinase protein
MTEDTTIDASTITQAVRLIDPTWSLQAHEPAAGGYLPVYVLTLDTPAGSTQAVLKASPDGERHGIDVEARILRLLEARTSLPVPEVYGAVDEHDELPAPYFLSAYAPGATVERDELHTLENDHLETLARASGQYIAELHSLDLFDAYGYLERAPDRTLRGERPPTAPESVVVTHPTDSWREQVRAWTDDTVSGAATTRFGDLVPDVEPVLDDRISRLDGAFQPVLGHIDNSIENLKHDPETGEITAMLDWAFSLSVTPGYDLVLIEQSLSGGQWRLVHDTPDYTSRIRAALLDGYRREGATRALRELDRHRDLYELLSLLRSMNNLETWLSAKNATPAQIDAAVRTIRDRTRAIINDG